ncbi:MAG: FliG C-terminal domain-containing protein [Pseudomonadota bacterium]
MTAPPRVSGPDKAALMMIALDESTGADVLRSLSEAEIRRLAAAVDSLPSLSPDGLEQLYEDFRNTLEAGIQAREGSVYLRGIAALAFGEERAKRLLAPAATWTEPLEYLRNMRPNILAETLAEEHPQVGAALVSQLPRQQAAKVVNAWPTDQQADLMRRLAELVELPLDAVKSASAALAQTLVTSGRISDPGINAEFDGVTFVADILNEMPPAETERLLSSMDVENPELVVQVRRAMFSFEDLIRLPKRAMVALLREVQADDLVVALKTASEALQQHFLSAMSQRAAESLREDMIAAPPLRLSEVETKQMKVVEIAMRLKGEGKIEIPTHGGDKLV